MGDNDEKKDSFIRPFLDKCLKKTKKPFWVLLIVCFFRYGASIGIISLNIIEYIVFLFIIACIIWSDKIVTCIDKCIDFAKFKEKQKTIRHRQTEKRKIAKYEYLQKQKKGVNKERANTLNQNDDNSPCKIYEIKRKGS